MTHLIHFSTSVAALHNIRGDTVRTKCHEANHQTPIPSVLTLSVKNSRGIKFVMISATIMSASGTAETAPSTRNSPGGIVLLKFLAGTCSRTGSVTRSVTILGVSLTALNVRTQKLLANMTDTVLTTMAMTSVTTVVTLSPVAGMALTVPLILHQSYWMVY